jgi:hypothetical protein
MSITLLDYNQIWHVVPSELFGDARFESTLNSVSGKVVGARPMSSGEQRSGLAKPDLRKGSKIGRGGQDYPSLSQLAYRQPDQRGSPPRATYTRAAVE